MSCAGAKRVVLFASPRASLGHAQKRHQASRHCNRDLLRSDQKQINLFASKTPLPPRQAVKSAADFSISICHNFPPSSFMLSGRSDIRGHFGGEKVGGAVGKFLNQAFNPAGLISAAPYPGVNFTATGSSNAGSASKQNLMQGLHNRRSDSPTHLHARNLELGGQNRDQTPCAWMRVIGLHCRQST